MSIVYKCKECGGEIELQDNGLGKCLYCGALQTLPKDKDDKIQNLLNRANDFRLNCDFDRAIFEYEEVLKLSETEPEAHWGLFLSKYGVEYVKDNMTFTYKPTLHRISSVSVFDDVDYKATLKYADSISVIQYKKDAEDIEMVMKELLLLSANQEPYDVFLSYKEMDDVTRQRTDDSYLAHDLYNELTSKGYKVFFAPKSLGVGLFEPKIYSAIISSKVMLVLGTQPKYFDAIWVKNEWSRFAELIDNGEQKVLIPIFKNMEAGQLPNKLAKYQALDMANISFLQTLTDLISQSVNHKSRVNFNKDSSAEDAYLERGFLALEDRNFQQANGFFESVLNLNPHNSQAYFGKLMVEMKISKQEQIVTSNKYLDEYSNFEKAVRFADQQLKTTLIQYEKKVKEALDTQKFHLLSNELEEKSKSISSNNSSDTSELASEIQVLNTKKEEIESLINRFQEISDYDKTPEKITFCKKIISEIDSNINRKQKIINDIEAEKKRAEEARLWKTSIKRSATPLWLLFIAVGLVSGPLMAKYIVIPYILPLAYEHIDFEIPDLVFYIGMFIVGGISGALMSHWTQEKYQIAEHGAPLLILSVLVPVVSFIATALVILALALVVGLIYIVIAIVVLVIGGLIAASCCGG